MEVAGLVIGGVSLASLFTTCVDCFEYIQLGRQFGRDYQTAVLRLDLLKLRLSRWASAVNDSDYGVSVQSDDEIVKVKEVLGQIIELFEATEKSSKKFKASDDGAGMADLDKDFESIHLKMKNLALKRQNRSSFAKKVSWVLHEAKYFTRLIEDLEPLVRDLVDMFPAVEEQQRELSVQEAEELQADRGVVLLQDANQGEDELLREAIAQALASQVKHQFVGNIAKDEVQVRYGDEYEGGAPVAGTAGSKYEKNEASGKARVQYGDHYGQGSIFR
ncbi:heterokaryon incompatibility protein s [Rhypophila decipiens]|uniref:Heterokaryon incompatibility protein s n=1 Tax=Rhypophila decipiens TaxID=261697 RepID=A0AAN7BA05_9PEZI|nr:heterokaryon incompatibility protein s [Rhypophila decipiens]